MTRRIAVLASGTGSNFVRLASAARAGELGDASIVVMLCNKPGAAVLDRAHEAGVEALLLPHRDFARREDFDAAMVAALREHDVEFVVLAGFMRVLTPVFLNAFPARVMNVHPALLPAFPGADAIGDAMAYGAKVTGVTVHLVDAGVDTGPIVAQEAVTIHEDDTRETLAARLHAVEHRLLPFAVRAMTENRLLPDGRRMRVLAPEVDAR